MEYNFVVHNAFQGRGFAGELARVMASNRIPYAIPSPRDVKHVVFFGIESSNVLLDRSNASSMSFFISRSSLAVDMRG